MEEPQGRLELTWSNKDKRLLANEQGGYTWVDRADYRVAEVRLLHQTGACGRVSSRRSRDNLLIRGDALHALRSLASLPEFAAEYAGKVRLAYLDPPFNTEQAFTHYDDALEHSVWLTMMRDRLEQVKRLLSPIGSVWVHCDDREQHRLRVVLDEVFGEQAFVATVIWQKRTSRENRSAFSPSQDYIHVYAPSGPSVWKNSRNRLTDTSGGFANPDNDPDGPWRSIPMSAQAGHATSSQFYEITTPSGVVHSPPRGRSWTVTERRFVELLDAGRVYFPKKGSGKPRLKLYPHEVTGLVPFTLWPTSDVDGTDDAKREILDFFPDSEPFDTPKPERLMRRTLEIGSDPGDLVLDCFLGSGTTASVAHKLGRKWIGIEREAATVRDFAEPRLRKVVEGKDFGGVTEDVEWAGGGGFRVLEVAPSMFEVIGDRVVLSDWATNGQLAEAVAAQLHAAYEPDPPFAGRRGRTRVSVVDGLVNADVVKLLIQELGVDEVLHVCGTALDPSVQDTLQALKPGSVAQKIPESILQGYRREFGRRRRWERVHD